jgi:uncharacterized protein YqiB (DUF1249 family)
MMLINRNQTDLLCSKPTFAGLMELYENNYIYVRRLMPELDLLGERGLSRVRGGVDLHLTVLERCPYTTTVALTHYFGKDPGEDAIPDLYVRIYHDARSAEVLPASPLNNFSLWGTMQQPDVSSLKWRWVVNRFLNRWLRYCLGEGHQFRVHPIPSISSAQEF